jgi:hypothetical protein
VPSCCPLLFSSSPSSSSYSFRVTTHSRLTCNCSDTLQLHANLLCVALSTPKSLDV